MNVIVEKNDRVWTVTINRPEIKNAVDRDTARELAEVFRDFDADPESDAAVLCGAEHCFCAGADLKSVSSGISHRLEETGDGPMGPSRMVLGKPVIAAIAGYAVAGKG